MPWRRKRAGDEDLTVNPSTLTFTTSDWNTPQTVTVSAAADADTAAGTATITHAATSTDSAYTGLTITSVTATETDNNAAPAFTSAATISVAENATTVGTVTATDGDASDSITGYAITGGADQGKFSIDTNGALTFKSAPNYEDPTDAGTDNTYAVAVTATSGTSTRALTATQTITVTVTDVNEPPSAPATPTISSVTASGFTVTWTAPANTGPAITDYDVQYRVSGVTAWTDAGHTGTALTLTLTGLTASASYEVQVLAKNAEGTSAWSATATATTTAAANAAPTFTSLATFTVEENETTVGTVTATDADASDSITGYAITGGADQGKFSIDANGGALTFASAPNYEAPSDADTDNAYLVEVTATSGTSPRTLTAVQAITVTVTDVDGEAPTAPATPTISAETADGFTVTWTAPENAGPAITGYAVQYREGTSGSWTNAGHSGTGLTVTLSGLKASTSYQVQVQATNAEGTSGWSASATATTTAAPNVAPTFGSAATFSVAENETSVGTVTATDADALDSITGYAISGGADQGKFSIDAGTGALTFQSAPNYEDPTDTGTDNTYAVAVTATGGTSTRALTATQTITVTVTDVAEPPSAPATPTISSVTATGFTVMWAAPTNTGPAITDYDVQYRVSGVTAWTDAGHTGTGLTLTLSGLTASASYEVQVLAKNAEGTSAWSATATATTTAAANAAPTFTSLATFTVEENETTVGTVTATDADASDSITGYAISGGADQGKFSIDMNSGALTFASAPNYEAPSDADTDNAYLVEVTATSGTSPRTLTAVQAITVTVTDVDGEAPTAPATPTISAETADGFTVTWTAPENAGPAITGYAVQYREGTSGSWTNAGHSGTGLTVTLSGLKASTSYQVQVQATNAEGTSGWSATATGTTAAAANEAPTFSSPATFSVAENTAAVGTVAATDADALDSITGYAISGGADQGKFSIDAGTGALTFQSAPNYEDPTDTGTDNTYAVAVTATGGTSTRALTATQTITVTVTDMAEPPSAPATPTISAVTASGFTVTWTEPANTGPAITGYAVQYREGTSGSWTNAGHSGTGLTVTLSGLKASTSYQVQVQATNAEGTSGWSATATGTTTAAANEGADLQQPGDL